MYRKKEIQLYIFITSAQDEINLTLRPLYSPYRLGRRISRTQRLNFVMKREIPIPTGNQTLVVQLLASHYIGRISAVQRLIVNNVTLN
jgi:hypothetical protein